MQYYTKQQMAGGTRYTGKTMIGNWNEDFSAQDGRVMEVLHKAQTGTLKLNAHTNKLDTQGCPVELTGGTGDGAITLGEPIEIVSTATGSRLAVDLDERSPGQSMVTGTTGETYGGPSARCTFVLEQYVPPKENAYDSVYEGPALRYGMKVRVLVNAAALGADAADTGKAGETTRALCSAPKSSGALARLSKHQAVAVADDATTPYHCVWQVVTPRASERVVSEGLEVLQGAPVALVHCATLTPLCMEGPHMVLTDFGYEHEVSCHADVSSGRVDAMDSLFQGKHLRDNNVFILNIGFDPDAPAAEGAAPAGEAAAEE